MVQVAFVNTVEEIKFVIFGVISTECERCEENSKRGCPIGTGELVSQKKTPLARKRRKQGHWNVAVCSLRLGMRRLWRLKQLLGIN